MTMVKRFTILALYAVLIASCVGFCLVSEAYLGRCDWMNKRCTEEANFKETEIHLWAAAVDAGWSEDSAMSLSAAMWAAHAIDMRNRAE